MYLLLVISALLMTANTALTKVFQKTTPSDFMHLVMYNLINALFACVFFVISARFSISLNTATVIYAVVYALIICINLSMQIVAFSKAPVSVVTLVSMAGGVLLPSLFGIVYFGEPKTWQLAVSSVLIIVAAVLPFAGKPSEKKPFSFGALLSCTFMFVLNGMSVILMKLYAIDEKYERVCDSTSMFFLTNAAIVAVCIIVIYFLIFRKNCFENGKVISGLMHAFTPLQTLNIGSKTALANVSSVLQVIILAEMSASTFSVLNSSLTLIGAGAVSALIFREKQTPGALFAIAFAIAAIAVNP